MFLFRFLTFEMSNISFEVIRLQAVRPPVGLNLMTRIECEAKAGQSGSVGFEFREIDNFVGG